MLNHPHSLPHQFVTEYLLILIAIAYAWALVVIFLFSDGWRRRRHLLAQVLDMGINAMMVAVMMYLPFFALAIGARLGWL